MREMRAKKYNQEHAKEAAEFQKVTGVDPMNIAAVKKWPGRPQRRHRREDRTNDVTSSQAASCRL
jgi:hypothetical protein